MEKRKPTKTESAIITVIAALVIATVKFRDQLMDKNLLNPLIILIFVGGFGFLGFQVRKLWKQSDEEILGIYPGGQTTAPAMPTPSFRDRLRFFLGAIAMVLFILVKEKQVNPGSLIFCGFVLTIASIYFLPALIQKLRGKEDQPMFPNSPLRSEHYLMMLFGLFGVCFCGFFCFIVITKTPWWLAIPFLFPPLIIGSAAARPLVAALRILFKSKEKDSGQRHVRQGQDIDPWDRPDRKL